MKQLTDFLKYNNTVPIVISFLLLGAASTYAATNPEVLISKEQEVVSIDNTYIAEKDLGRYSPSVRILSVREDAESYFVVYEFSTIELVDHVWQDIVETREMVIAKTTLGNYRDLGEFVTKQLNELISNELERLKETQVFEKKKVTQMKVTTKYKGIVGGFLDAKTETIAGYKPVVKIKEPEPEPETFARPDPNAKVPAVPVPAPIEPEPVQEPEPPIEEQPEEEEQVPDDTVEEIHNEPPQLTILGENPMRVPVSSSYTDLGVVVSDDHDSGLPVLLFLNDVPVSNIAIDTSATGTYTITYEVTDTDGLIAQKKRIVEVFALNATTTPEISNEEIATSTVDEEREPTPEPVIEPEPTPEPEPVPEETPVMESEETGGGEGSGQ